MADNVNHPKHYTQGKIEVIDFILDQKLGYLESNIIKYICRYKYKNGSEDLKKAQWYINKLIQEDLIKSVAFVSIICIFWIIVL